LQYSSMDGPLQDTKKTKPVKVESMLSVNEGIDLQSTAKKKADTKERSSASGIHKSGSQQGQSLDSIVVVTAAATVVSKPKSEQRLSPPLLKSLPSTVPVVKQDKKKKFSLGILMRPMNNSSSTPQQQEEEALETKSTLTSFRSKDTLPPPTHQKLPKWLSQVSESTTTDLTDENRIFALEFFEQAVSYIPEAKGTINYDAIARNLEHAVYDWSFDNENNDDNDGDEGLRPKMGTSRVINGRGKKIKTTKSNNHPSNGACNSSSEDIGLDRYWNKIHALVASISGKQQVGSIAGMIANGQFHSSKDLVKLSDESLYKSFLGQSPL
jgi:hypothetical protein